jgi:hypothetical protein
MRQEIHLQDALEVFGQGGREGPDNGDTCHRFAICETRPAVMCSSSAASRTE